MEKNNSLLRLKKVLLSDKINMPNGFLMVLKKDLKNVLDSYFECNEDSLKIEVDTDTNGEYDICITSKAERIKSPKFFN